MPETILETPDSVARAAQQYEQARTDGGALGEKLTLNVLSGVCIQGRGN